MDMTKYATKQYLNAEIVMNETVMVLVILNEGKASEGKYGEQVTFDVEYNGKDYLYSPNGESITNLIEAFGTDSRKWMSKPIAICVRKSKNDNDIIVALGEEKVKETEIKPE